MKRVIVALNGELQASKDEYRRLFSPEEMFIAADGGALFLEEIGFQPNLIIGDLDSLPAGSISKYKQKGIAILRYPVEKDETDGELALAYCSEKGYSQVTITGALGGRLDQQLANIFLLEYAQRQGLKAMIKEPGVEIGLITEKIKFQQQKRAYLSLLPLSRQVEGVVIKGCKYKLDGANLKRYESRGISNYIDAEVAEVSISKGLLLYVLRN